MNTHLVKIKELAFYDTHTGECVRRYLACDYPDQEITYYESGMTYHVCTGIDQEAYNEAIDNWTTYDMMFRPHCHRFKTMQSLTNRSVSLVIG
jgi:hypothetical protein